jgi:hypothetical protein
VFFAMLDEAFGLELGEHRADGRVARRITEPRANVFDGSAVGEGEDDVHDFALAAGEFRQLRHFRHIAAAQPRPATKAA